MRHLLWIPALAASLAFADVSDAADGKALYDKNCSQCHGLSGAGDGAAAPRVNPRPRDFTRGKFKIRTTAGGALPTDADIKNIIVRGMPYTSMPAWPQFNDEELNALVDYIKTFSEDFENPDKSNPKAIDLPAAPAYSEDSAAAGRAVFVELGCVRCHGDQGRADGISATTLEDDWGHHLRPANLQHRWTFRGGATREDIFRAVSTGLNGTPMPAYAEASTVEQRWQLVDYLTSIGRGATPNYANLITVKQVEGIDPEAEGFDELFDAAAVGYVPIVGQLQEPGREFQPSATEIAVRAIYDDDSIAFELRWHDMRQETSGSNAPDLAVPTFEEDPFRGAKVEEAPAEAEAFDEDDPFGDAEMDEADPFADEEVGEDDLWDEGGEDDASAGGPDTEFSDAIAIQFPSERVTGIRRPYFIFGDADHPVDLWFYDLAGDGPALWKGRGSDSLESGGPGDLVGSASYEAGEWRVVLVRKREVRGETPFGENEFVPVAFSVWDGFNRERGNKRGLSQWLYVYLEPGGEKSATGPMVKAAATALILEILVIGLVRRRFRGEDLDSIGSSANAGGSDV